jgi:hypothetical protein
MARSLAFSRAGWTVYLPTGTPAPTVVAISTGFHDNVSVLPDEDPSLSFSDASLAHTCLVV